MSTTDDRRRASTIETAQLRQLLFTIGTILVLFGIWAGIGGWGFGDPRYREMTLVIASVLASVVAADALTRHGRPQVGVLTVCASILTGAILSAWVDPSLYPTLVLASLLPAAIMLLHRQTRARRSVVVLCWLTAVAIAIAGNVREVEPGPALPSWFAAGFLLASVGAASGLVLLLFWQGSQRLMARFDQLQEAHLRLSEERTWMDLLAASMVDGVLATDRDGYVKVLNATAERLTGWTRREAHDRDLAEVFDIDPPVVFPSDLHEASREANGPISANEPLSLVSRDGVRRLVTMTAAPLHRNGAEYAGSVLVFRDVTDRVRQEALGLSPLPAVIECLSGRAAQEFRNLLTAVSGRADLLEALALPSDAGEHVEAIRDISTRGTFLARQLLRLYRRAPEPARRIDVAEELHQLWPMLDAILSPDITLTLDASADLGSILASPQAIDYPLLVLATGARDVMRAGGDVFVEASIAARSGDAPRQMADEASADDPRPHIRLAVWMTARWDQEEEPRSAWEAPFAYMSKGTPRPMPGLSVAARLVADAGGTLVANTHGPARRVYTMDFPTIAAEPALAAAGPATVATVLVVEDNPSVLAVLTETLRHHGYSVLAAADSAEAVRLVQAHAGRIDVGLIDVELPEERGPSLGVRLKGLQPTLPIVFMSDAGRLERVGAEWAGEAAGVLEKPFLPAAMLSLVKRVVERH